MALLFDLNEGESDVPNIPGLKYLTGYISEREEAQLVEQIDLQPWDNTWERRRQPYGGAYGKQKQPALPIPAWGQQLAERIFREGLAPNPFDQMLVNEYLPGQGIALHRDYEPFDRTVASISLLSACLMDFRRMVDPGTESLFLERRSLLVLSDEARYDWQHGIARRKSDPWHGARIKRARRLSITFRTFKKR